MGLRITGKKTFLDRKELGLFFVSNQQQDAKEFLTVLINWNESFDVLTSNKIINTKKCWNLDWGCTTTQYDKFNIIHFLQWPCFQIYSLVEDGSRPE